MDIKKPIEEKEKIEKQLETYYLKKIEDFKKDDIEKYNPYQATELPSKQELEPFIAQVTDQVGGPITNQIQNQIQNQIWDQFWNQFRNEATEQIWSKTMNKIRDRMWNQIWNQFRSKVRNEATYQVWNQIWATSYWGIKMALDLPINHWFFDFLKLGVMIVFVGDKVKVFGKNGKYLGEYDKSEFGG